MLCCRENVIHLLVTLVHIANENKSVKFIVIVKEMFYICHLPTLICKVFPKIHMCMVFAHIRK